MFHRFCQKSKTGTFHLGKCNCFFLLHYFRKRPQRKQGLFNKTALLAKPCPYGSLEWTNQALLALERAFWKGSTCLKGEGWREVYVLSQMPLNPTHWSFNRHMFILSLCSALHSFLTSCLISLLNPYFSASLFCLFFETLSRRGRSALRLQMRTRQVLHETNVSLNHSNASSRLLQSLSAQTMFSLGSDCCSVTNVFSTFGSTHVAVGSIQSVFLMANEACLCQPCSHKGPQAVQ